MRFAFICVALLSFSGCIEYLEEIWINDDGSGKLKIDLGVAESFVSLGKNFGMQDSMQDMTKQYLKRKEELEQNPNVKKADFKEFTENGLHHFVFEIEVKDIFKVGELTKKLEMSQLDSQGQQDTSGKSEIKIEKLPNGNIQFVQIFKGERKESTQTNDSSIVANDSVSQAMATAMFGDKGVTIRIHAPQIISSNGKLDEQMKSVEWKIGLAELAKGSFSKELKAEIELHRVSALMVTVIIVAALLCLLIMMLMLKARRNPLL